jgi:hypothetical protein
VGNQRLKTKPVSRRRRFGTPLYRTALVKTKQNETKRNETTQN